MELIKPPLLLISVLGLPIKNDFVFKEIPRGELQLFNCLQKHFPYCDAYRTSDYREADYDS